MGAEMMVRRTMSLPADTVARLEREVGNVSAYARFLLEREAWAIDRALARLEREGWGEAEWRAVVAELDGPAELGGMPRRVDHLDPDLVSACRVLAEQERMGRRVTGKENGESEDDRREEES
jgi:hypothetical protein